LLSKLKNQNIENIVIFVSDSLRWDFIPKKLMKMGITVKTIASSLYTAPSFPSIVSGLYPPKHGVYTWSDILPKRKRRLLELETHNVSLWCETTWTNLPPDKSQIHTILGDPKGISLENIDRPFIYIEDDKGGHCPYGYPFTKFMEGGCPDFFKEYGKKGRNKLIKQYKRGIKQSVTQFKKRIKTLEERGLINNTLLVFTSDHGELLGEYGGLTGHGRPPCPELIYVPTVFIHPSLEPKELTNGVYRHVDLYPTIAGILDIGNLYLTDGINLTETEKLPQRGMSFRKGGYMKSESNLSRWMKYGCSSIWDYNGGHVFHDLKKIMGLSMFSFKILLQNHPEFNFLRENGKRYKITKRFQRYREVIKKLSDTHLIYKQPNFSKYKAESLINQYLDNVGKIETEIVTIKEKEVKDRLRALGYFD